MNRLLRTSADTYKILIYFTTVASSTNLSKISLVGRDRSISVVSLWAETALPGENAGQLPASRHKHETILEHCGDFRQNARVPEQKLTLYENVGQIR